MNGVRTDFEDKRRSLFEKLSFLTKLIDGDAEYQAALFLETGKILNARIEADVAPICLILDSISVPSIREASASLLDKSSRSHIEVALKQLYAYHVSARGPPAVSSAASARCHCGGLTSTSLCEDSGALPVTPIRRLSTLEERGSVGEITTCQSPTHIMGGKQPLLTPSIGCCSPQHQQRQQFLQLATEGSSASLHIDAEPSLSPRRVLRRSPFGAAIKGAGGSGSEVVVPLSQIYHTTDHHTYQSTRNDKDSFRLGNRIHVGGRDGLQQSAPSAVGVVSLGLSTEETTSGRATSDSTATTISEGLTDSQAPSVLSLVMQQQQQHQQHRHSSMSDEADKAEWSSSKNENNKGWSAFIGGDIQQQRRVILSPRLVDGSSTEDVERGGGLTALTQGLAAVAPQQPPLSNTALQERNASSQHSADPMDCIMNGFLNELANTSNPYWPFNGPSPHGEHRKRRRRMLLQEGILTGNGRASQRLVAHPSSLDETAAANLSSASPSSSDFETVRHRKPRYSKSAMSTLQQRSPSSLAHPDNAQLSPRPFFVRLLPQSTRSRARMRGRPRGVFMRGSTGQTPRYSHLPPIQSRNIEPLLDWGSSDEGAPGMEAKGYNKKRNDKSNPSEDIPSRTAVKQRQSKTNPAEKGESSPKTTSIESTTIETTSLVNESNGDTLTVISIANAEEVGNKSKRASALQEGLEKKIVAAGNIAVPLKTKLQAAEAAHECTAAPDKAAASSSNNRTFPSPKLSARDATSSSCSSEGESEEQRQRADFASGVAAAAAVAVKAEKLQRSSPSGVEERENSVSSSNGVGDVFVEILSDSE